MLNQLQVIERPIVKMNALLYPVRQLLLTMHSLLARACDLLMNADEEGHYIRRLRRNIDQIAYDRVRSIVAF